jgi:ribose-phosphate pyrophosphokinase
MVELMKETARIYRDKAMCSVWEEAIGWNLFPNGFPNFKIESVNLMKGKDVVFFASFDKPDDVILQMWLIRAIPRYLAKSLTVVLPFFPTATDERIDEDGHIASAKSLTRELENIPFCRGSGPARIIFIDEHIKTLRFFFNDNVIPVPISAMSLAREGLERFATPAVAFPDDGAKKRFAKAFPNTPLIICDKVRHGDERVVTIKEGDPKDKQVLIIDDMTRTGGTLEECRKALVKAGAYTVSAFVTHAPFDGNAWERFFRSGQYDKECGFLDFVTTDSCPPVVKKIVGYKPFKVLSLADLIAKEIM